MAFESLSEKLSSAFKKLTGKGRLKETDVKEAMREVKLALLEADVNFKVVKDFVKKVTDRAVGMDILESLNPAQMVIKIVNEELVALMGSDGQKLNIGSKTPSIVMLVGLQGAGKTTRGAKWGGYMRRGGKTPLRVVWGVSPPAAIKQLETVGSQLGIPVYQEGQGDPVQIARNGIEYAKRHGQDLVFLDTAGRLHIDETLMDELVHIRDTVEPAEILLVVDAMTGQDAVNAASAFDEALGVTGVLLSKLDGDARGGAALSIRAVTGKPIKFAGMGEKLDQIEPFYPDRMAGRILGMGDVLSLIEKAEQAMDEKKAEQLAQRMLENKFTLTDYLDQLEAIQGMGSLADIAAMMPGIDAKALENADPNDSVMRRTKAIIQSMTHQERENPGLLNASRKRRIASGAGVAVVDVNRVLKQYDTMQQMMKQMNGAGKRQMKKQMKKARKNGGVQPGVPMVPGKGSPFGKLFK